MHAETMPSVPTAFISYSHDNEVHRSKVLAFAETLLAAGVQVTLDRYVENDPPQSWARWMYDEMSKSSFSLVICTKTYEERALGHTEGLGFGANWEGMVITQDLYQKRRARTYIPICFDQDDENHIPYYLAGTTHYVIEDPRSPAQMEPLLRRLYNEPTIKKPSLGSRPNFLPTLVTPHLRGSEELRASIEAISRITLFQPRTGTSSGPDDMVDALAQLRQAALHFAKYIAEETHAECRINVQQLLVSDGRDLRFETLTNAASEPSVPNHASTVAIKEVLRDGFPTSPPQVAQPVSFLAIPLLRRLASLEVGESGSSFLPTIEFVGVLNLTFHRAILLEPTLYDAVLLFAELNRWCLETLLSWVPVPFGSRRSGD